jgi:hypothetical protein
MRTKYFSGVEDHDRVIIAGICSDIENGRITVISTDRKFKIVSPGDNGYLFDWTYNFIRFGFARKSRSSEFHAQQHPYCPNQTVNAIIANFINTAVDMGFYERATSKRFDGGQNINIIWM